MLRHFNRPPLHSHPWDRIPREVAKAKRPTNRPHSQRAVGARTVELGTALLALGSLRNPVKTHRVNFLGNQAASTKEGPSITCPTRTLSPTLSSARRNYQRQPKYQPLSWPVLVPYLSPVRLLITTPKEVHFEEPALVTNLSTSSSSTLNMSLFSRSYPLRRSQDSVAHSPLCRICLIPPHCAQTILRCPLLDGECLRVSSVRLPLA